MTIENGNQPPSSESSDRKQVEKELTASEPRYRRLFETAKDGILILDAETGMVVDANPFMHKMLGYSQEQFVGKTIWELGFLKDIIANRDNFLELQQKEYIRYEDLPLETIDGRRIDVEFVSNVYYVDNKKVIQCNIRDITEWLSQRNWAKEALRQSEEKFRILFEHAADIILQLDFTPEGIPMIREANSAASKLLGYERDELIGQPVSFLEAVPNASKVVDERRRNILSGVGTVFETRHRCKNGTIRDFECSATEMQVGSRTYAISVERDITERKRMEEELLHNNMQLDQKRRDLEQLIYVTSHDLRTPLVNVQGFGRELSQSLMALTEAVQTGDISPEVMDKIGPIIKTDVPEALGYIQSGITQMDKQLSALLRLSRLGRAAIIAEKVDMQKTVSEVVKSLEYMAKEKGAEIQVSQLPPCMADTAQMNQIVLNLIENALKYLDAKRPGVIRISANKLENAVVYCVEDNGVGIAQEYQNRIFEIFYRIEPGRNTGEGLGLTIVRQCAEKQNGSVWVESEIGKGSRFFVKLPGAQMTQ